MRLGLGVGLRTVKGKLINLITDETPPTVSDGALTVSNSTLTSFTITFNKSTDNETLQEKLIYSLYTSPSGSLNSISDIDLNGTVRDVGTDVSSLTADLLSLDSYNLNVVVTDEAGNQSIYNSTNINLI